MSLALAQEQVNFWWVLIGIAVVVIACVIALLSLLSALVKDISRHVADVEVEVVAGSANTSASPFLGGAADRIADLGVELSRHVDLLSAREAQR
jgi:hypothetical protein